MNWELEPNLSKRCWYFGFGWAYFGKNRYIEVWVSVGPASIKLIGYSDQ